MWLLDANLDLALVPFLRSQNIDCEAAALRGWADLTNGELAEAAVDAAFTCLLTRDRRFAESAADALRDRADLAVVVVTLPQQPSEQYLESFKSPWKTTKIQPVAGRAIIWP